MDFTRRSFPLANFNPSMRQKQYDKMQQQNLQAGNITRRSYQVAGSYDSQIANLKQCISAYFDSIQMVCRAGSWLAETLSLLLDDSSLGTMSCEMKSKFSKMQELSLSTTMKARTDLAAMLVSLSLPNVNYKNHLQAIKDCKIHNAKILEKCIHCLSDVHNSFFKVQLDIKVGIENEPSFEKNDSCANEERAEDFKSSKSPARTEKPTVDYVSEWNRLCDTNLNARSWAALKERTDCLRKYNGLSETEIQNLLKGKAVSNLYLGKLNQRIDTALRNYEVGLRGLPSESVLVFGSFSSFPSKAKAALQGCCSKMEMEQGTQRLPASQFLHCELPLMSVTIHNKEYSADTANSSANINQKKNAVRQLLQLTNHKLSISETDELSYEILGDVCPARWRIHVKASLQLLYGNAGLVIMDTVDGESSVKRSATISRKERFIVVSVTSTWCLKEDPGSMSLLQRNVDPEKSLAVVHVRYVSVFQNKSSAEKRFHPGIFVETFVQTGSQNRRRASQTLRKTQTLSGMPLTLMSSCWLTSKSVAEGSPVSVCRVTSAFPTNEKANLPEQQSSAGNNVSKVDDAEHKSERKRKKKLVVEIKEGDTSSEEEKSSDNDDSVKEVINMLSGGSRPSNRRRYPAANDKLADTDMMSKATDDILDSNLFCTGEKSPKNNQAKDPQIPTSQEDSLPQQLPDISQRKNIYFQTPPSPAYQSQENVAPATNLASYVPFHFKSKSQTLPGTFGGNVQANYEQDAKSLSNTLPLYGSHLYWTANHQHAISQSVKSMPSQNYATSTVALTPPPPFCPPPRSMATAYMRPTVDANAQSNISPAGMAPPTDPLSYGLWLRDSATLDANLPVTAMHVKDMLQSVKNLSISYESLSQQQKVEYQDRYLAQHRLVSGPKQNVGDNLVGSPLNSNNNNMVSGIRTDAVDRSTGQQHCGSHQSNVFGGGQAAPTDDRNIQVYSTKLSNSPYSTYLPIQEELSKNGEHVNEANQFIATQSQESLGPIGSPVVRRQIKGMQQQPPSLQKNSNTWPIVHDFPNQIPLSNGDQEYNQYIATVARNAMISRKQMQNDYGRPVVSSSELNNARDEESWHPLKFSKPDGSQSKPLGERLMNDGSSHGDALGMAQERMDAPPTGTWPPWQVWSSGSNGMWNWGADVLSPDFQKNTNP